MLRLHATLSLLVVLFLHTVQALSPDDEALIDAFMEDVLLCTQVPGMNLAAVHHGKTLITKGYGVADLATQEPVTASTLFSVASITKGFTAILNAIMFSRAEGCVGPYFFKGVLSLIFDTFVKRFLLPFFTFFSISSHRDHTQRHCFCIVNTAAV